MRNLNLKDLFNIKKMADSIMLVDETQYYDGNTVYVLYNKDELVVFEKMIFLTEENCIRPINKEDREILVLYPNEIYFPDGIDALLINDEGDISFGIKREEKEIDDDRFIYYE